ncbi:MAG: ABC transporter permease [Chloroflexota bacterium]
MEAQVPRRTARATLVALARAVLILAGSSGLALAAGGAVIGLAGRNPLAAYGSMLAGSFGSTTSLPEVVVPAIPLALCAVGIALASRVRLWNIGAEGQFHMGAFAAGGLALFLPSHLPGLLMIALMASAGALAGGLWAGIAAWLRVSRGINEALTTLLLNYVAILWIQYVAFTLWKDPNGFGFPGTPVFPDAATLPTLGTTRIHLGLAFAIVAAALSWLLVSRTRWGFAFRVVGESPSAAEYAGISVARVTILAMVLAGGLAGLAGMAEVTGIVHRLQDGISPGYGYTAIIVAWLARLNPWAILLVAFLFGGLLVGGDQLQMSMGLSSGIALVLQAAILLFAISGDSLLALLRRSTRRDTSGTPT